MSCFLCAFETITGIFELLRSAVGIYASSYEDVASAKIYMYSWFIIGGSSLLSFVSRAASNLSWDVIFYQLLFWGLWIYFTMVSSTMVGIQSCDSERRSS